MKSKYLRLLRPIAWITFLLPFTAGFGLGITSDSNPLDIVFAFIAFSCWMSFSFIINSIVDKDVDKLHNGRSKDMNLSLQPLVTGEINEKKAWNLSIFFLFSSLFFAWLINNLFFILILLGDIIGYVYSMPPMRFKARPLGDIICNTSAGGLIFVAGLSIGGANMHPLLIFEVFIMTSIFYIPTVVTDHEFDKKAGLKTSAVYFTPKRLLNALYPLTVLLVIIAIFIILTEDLELMVVGLFMIIYTIVSTIVVNINLKEDKLFVHENWIIIPFLLVSIGLIIYGIFKLFDFY